VRPKFRVSWVVVAGSAAALLVGWAPCSGEDATFDFRVDRFAIEMTGTVAQRKGIPDFVEEFDDPTLSGWFTQYGTAFTADGFLHLASPGTEVPDGLGVLPGTTLDLSVVGSERQVADGEGDFVARSYWEPDELASGDFNHMSLATLGRDPPGLLEVAGLAIMNQTRDGEPAAYTMVQHLVRFGAGGPEAPQLSSVAIEPSAITGQIVFELRFDDDANTLETAFSLDGGATFERPFLPLPIFHGSAYGYGYFLLGADPLTNTVRARAPAPPLCAGGTLIGDAKIVSSARAGSTIAVEGSILKTVAGPGRIVAFGPLRRRDYDPRRTGAEIRIIDRLLPETPILDLTSAAALRGGPGCGSHDGWRRVRNGFVYNNETGALPPGCIPGSAGGLTRVRLKHRTPVRLSNGKVRGGGLAYEVDLATAWRPIPGSRIATTIVLGDTTGSGAAAPCGTFEARCVASDASVRCE